MSHLTGNYLFDLIKSLSTGEKRTIKLLNNYASLKQKQHLVLFKIIDNATVYDEKKIKKKLNDLKIKTPFPSITNYLTELILKSLRFYNSGSSNNLKIIHLLSNAEILHAKGLEKHRNKLLLKAKKLAIKYEKQPFLLEVLNKEWYYRSRFFPKDQYEYKKTLTDLIKLQEYRELISIKSELQNKGEVRDERHQHEWDAIIKHPLMISSEARDGYEENFSYHHLQMRYYMRNNNPEKCVFHQTQLIKHMESRIDLLQDYKEEYFEELNSLLASYCYLNDLELANAAYTKLLNVKKWELNGIETIKYIETLKITYANLIHIHFINKQFEKAIALKNEAETLLKNNERYLVNNEFLYLTLAEATIYMGNYRAAVIWNNKVLNASVDNTRNDVMAFARIFNLIIHFELKHFDLLESLIRSTIIFFQKRKRLFQTETVILKYLKHKFPKSNSYRETLNLFREIKIELEVLKKDPYEFKAFEYFDYTVWLQSKIENKTLMEVLA